jgi:DNA (cytosine-5)-methyltransferase 1
VNGLDLFSGIGGISLALEPWVRTVAYCEQNRHAQSVLLSRMREGLLDRAPIWDDVRTLRGDMLPRIDIIFGGFPCQDISVAGRGAGLSGERSGLFFEIVRLIDECQPAFVFLENVPAIKTRGLNTVASTLADRGFNLAWTVLSAAEVGAPHLRKRWFCLASHPNRSSVWVGPKWRSGRWQRILQTEGQAESVDNGSEKSLAYSSGSRPQELHASAQSSEQGLDSGRFDPLRGSAWWATEPSMGRVAHGVPSRVDRIRCLGNAVVPAQAREAFRLLMNPPDERTN